MNTDMNSLPEGIKTLVDAYWDQISVEEADFIEPNNSRKTDAYVSIVLPGQMIRDYQSEISIKRDVPNGEEFWKYTGLCDKLLHTNRFNHVGPSDISIVLANLVDGVRVEFSETESEGGRPLYNHVKIRMEVYANNN